MDNTNKTAPTDEKDQDFDPSLDEIMSLEPKDVPKVDTEKAVAKSEDKTEATAKSESKRIRWRCKNCHYQYEGFEKLSACPRCGKDPSYFEDVE